MFRYISHIYLTVFFKLNFPATTPIEPVIVKGFACILFDETETIYPPDAATSDIDITTGFLSLRFCISFLIRSEASAEPPGLNTLTITPFTEFIICCFLYQFTDSIRTTGIYKAATLFA